MTPEQQHIADRILKLLAVASSTRFAEEADTARALADQLISKHNITLGPGKPGQDTIEVRPYVPFGKGMNWEGLILSALCNLCSCVVFNNHAKTDYALCGSIWNLDVLEYMVREVHRQRIVAWLAYKGGNGADRFNKFCYGFAKALNSKINELLDANAVEHSHCALVLWYEQNILHRKTVAGRGFDVGKASSQAGLDAGRNASLHRGALAQPFKQLPKG